MAVRACIVISGLCALGKSISFTIDIAIVILILISLVNIIDLLVDHWNMRGTASEVGFNIIYWMEIDFVMDMYAITQWLWYVYQICLNPIINQNESIVNVNYLPILFG